MDYFDQVMLGSEENILLLLGSKKSALTPLMKKSLFKRNVEIINIELSYLCNRKCEYCPVAQSSRKEKQEKMSIQLLEKILHELTHIRYENRISLNLYNEPLLDEFLEYKISLIRQKLPYSHISFNSNGDKLTKNRLETLRDAGCNQISITLHPLPNKNQSFETIEKRVSKLYEKLAQKTLAGIDLSEKNFIQFYSRGVGLKIQWPDWRTEGSNRGGVLINHPSKKFERLQPCIKPFREFTIYHDGIVQPCCEAFHDDKTNLAEMGNLNQKSIFDVYSSDSMNEIRRHVFDFGPKEGICKNCNVADYSKPKDDLIRKNILSRIL